MRFLFLSLMLLNLQAFGKEKVCPIDFDLDTASSSSVSAYADENPDYTVTLRFGANAPLEMDIYSDNTTGDLERHLKDHNGGLYNELVIEQKSDAPEISFRILFKTLWAFKKFPSVKIAGGEVESSLMVIASIGGGMRELFLENYTLAPCFFSPLFRFKNFIRSLKKINIEESVLNHQESRLQPRIYNRHGIYGGVYDLKWWEKFVWPNLAINVSYRVDNIPYKGNFIFHSAGGLLSELYGYFFYNMPELGTGLITAS
jgi:hypothetical protein